MSNLGKFLTMTLAAFVIAACGGDDTGGQETSTPEPTSADAPTATTSADTSSGPNISELARGVVQI